MGVINGETGTVLTSNEKVEEPPPVPATTSTPAGSYSSGAKKPPGTNDASKKHKSSKVCPNYLNSYNKSFSNQNVSLTRRSPKQKPLMICLEHRLNPKK